MSKTARQSVLSIVMYEMNDFELSVVDLDVIIHDRCVDFFYLIIAQAQGQHVFFQCFGYFDSTISTRNSYN